MSEMWGIIVKIGGDRGSARPLWPCDQDRERFRTYNVDDNLPDHGIGAAFGGLGTQPSVRQCHIGAPSAVCQKLGTLIR